MSYCGNDDCQSCNRREFFGDMFTGDDDHAPPHVDRGGQAHHALAPERQGTATKPRLETRTIPLPTGVVDAPDWSPSPTHVPSPETGDSPEAGDVMKKDTGKLRYDLIPVGPMRELARVYTIGAEKYYPRCWEEGMAWSRIISAMQRHVEAWRGGEQLDPVDGQHHLSSVAWCALALMEYEQTHPELDDRA